jgi:hypothetical protein
VVVLLPCILIGCFTSTAGAVLGPTDAPASLRSPATAFLNGHDRVVIRALADRLSAMQQLVGQTAPAGQRAAKALLSHCSPSQKRNKSVADSAEFSAGVLNLSFKLRANIHSTYAFVRAQVLNDKTLAAWLRSLKLAVTLGEKSGVLNHPIDQQQFCSILSRLNGLTAHGKLASSEVGNKFDELAGLDMHLVKASAATASEREGLRPLIEPLFRAAGLSSAEVELLANM